MKAHSLTSHKINFYKKAIEQSKNMTDPVFVQRLESAALAIFTLGFYVSLDANGWLFLALILAPDLSLLGYCKNQKLGSITYNLVHNYTLPIVVGALMVLFSIPLAVEVTLIWVAHIAIDRTMGYGLKYPTNFKHTHLSWK